MGLRRVRKGAGSLAALRAACRDPALFDRALSHRSCGVQHNEQLEFLGDAVLQLIVSEALCARFTQADPGALSRVRADWVCGERLAAIGRQLGLVAELRVDPGVREISDSMVANTLEALIGALFVDGGLDCARSYVLLWLAPQLAALPAELALPKDAKTRLQEHQQSCGGQLPEYVLTEHRDRDGVFSVCCHAAGRRATGTARTKRRAEQQAAAALLEQLEAASAP